MSQKSEFVSTYRQEVGNLLKTLNNLGNMRAQYDALDYATTLTDEDCGGIDRGITAAQLKDAVGTVTTLRNLLANNKPEAAKLYTVAR